MMMVVMMNKPVAVVMIVSMIFSHLESVAIEPLYCYHSCIRACV